MARTTYHADLPQDPLEAEQQGPRSLRNFEDTDWDGFAGAADLPDGRPPQIGETNGWIVVASGDGVGGAVVEFYDVENEGVWQIHFDGMEQPYVDPTTAAIRCAQEALAADPSVFITRTTHKVTKIA